MALMVLMELMALMALLAPLAPLEPLVLPDLLVHRVSHIHLLPNRSPV
jgi:hypothetical protein